MTQAASIAGWDVSVYSVAVCIGSLLVLHQLWSWLSRPQRNLPPGPAPKPFIGNILDLPLPGESASVHWSKHKKLYGPISSMTLMGQTLIIVNDLQIAKELLDKRWSNYSNRMQLTFAGEMLGFGKTLLFIQSGDDFRAQRKVAHNQLGSLSSLQKWNGDIDVETRRYLYRTLVQPDKWVRNLRQEAGSIILKIVYGYNVEPHSRDALVDIVEDVMLVLSKALVPGAWLVDIFPVLKYMPDWMPGAGFKQIAKKWSGPVYDSVDKPFRFTQRQMENGEVPISLTSESIRKVNPATASEEMEQIKFAAGSMFAAGSDTSAVMMELFYLAMVKFPDVQSKAQAEIEAVIGTSRLPELSDRPNLPYVEALIKEVIRWQPLGEVIPPHRSSEDDLYNGYFIPKKALVMVNARGICHDEEVYPEPSIFRPERHLGDDPELNPNELNWGFGRRICPGRWLAQLNVWLEISRTLACFDLRAVKGEEPSLNFTYGLVVRPEPFKVDIRVRSTEIEKIIRSVVVDHPFPEGDAKHL